MDERKKRGDWGEQAVAEDIQRQGGTILERQYRCRWGEIDLIARTADGILCFVEVKTRSAKSLTTPGESVTPAKQRKLRNAASWYLAQTGWDGLCRFDVAEVYPPEKGAPRCIKYIISAFQ